MMKQTLTTAQEPFDVYLTGPEKASLGVMILHDWWGVVEYQRQRAEDLAYLGYRSMIVDLYDGHHPNNAQDAGEFMRALDQEAAGRKMTAALETLRAETPKVAVLGWSLGGLQAQYAALDNPEAVDALILFYCRIVLNVENCADLHGPVLGIFAESERTWPDKQQQLEQILKQANLPFETVSYAADHGFANPAGNRHDAKAEAASFKIVTQFLQRHFPQP